MICEKLKNIAYCMKYAHDNSLRKYNLTSAQFLVLEYLIQNEGKDIIQKDLCEYLELKHTTVIGIIKRLEDKKFILKERGRKSNQISINNIGKKIFNEVGDIRSQYEEKLLKGFNKSEVTILNKQLDIMYKNIKNNI